MRHLAAAVLLLVVAGAAPAAAQDSLAAARDLYTSAGYEESLAMLMRLREAATEPAERTTIDQYRAFALFALGRTAEAEAVVEGIAAADPGWRLPPGEAPPRLAALFEKTRERALPAAMRQRLAAARALYAEKKYGLAAEAFTTILTLLEDPTIAQAIGTDAAPVASLATGFRDLALAADEQSRSAAAAPASTQAAIPAPTNAAPATSTRTSGAASAPEPVSDPLPAADGGGREPADATSAAPPPRAGGELGITPPVAITQSIPRPSDVAIPLGDPQTILLDLVIDEAGRVEKAEVRRSVNKHYEVQLIAAARTWRYRPATQGGRPVKYGRTLEVTLNPRRE